MKFVQCLSVVGLAVLTFYQVKETEGKALLPNLHPSELANPLQASNQFGLLRREKRDPSRGKKHIPEDTEEGSSEGDTGEDSGDHEDSADVSHGDDSVDKDSRDVTDDKGNEHGTNESQGSQQTEPTKHDPREKPAPPAGLKDPKTMNPGVVGNTLGCFLSLILTGKQPEHCHMG